MSREQDLQAFVERTVEEVERLAPYGRPGLRGALHKLVDRATQRWAHASTNTVVLSVSTLVHFSCKRWDDDGPSAVMELVWSNESNATFRCVRCGDEVNFCLNFIKPGDVVRPTTRKVAKKGKRR